MRKQSIYLLATQLLSKIAEEQSFEEAIKDKKFKNSETGNEVQFSSLPADDQKKVRAEWQKHLDKKEEDEEEDKEDRAHESVPAEAARIKSNKASEAADEANRLRRVAEHEVREAEKKLSKAEGEQKKDAEEELKKAKEELKKAEQDEEKAESEYQKYHQEYTDHLDEIKESLEKMTNEELLEAYEDLVENHSTLNEGGKKNFIRSMKEESPDNLRKKTMQALFELRKGRSEWSRYSFDHLKVDARRHDKRRDKTGHLMAEIRMNERRIASLEQRLAGAMDKPRQLQKGTWKIPVRAGHVLLSQWAVKHITAHNDIGTGSVFSRGMDEKTLIKLIQNAPVKGAGGLYTMKAPGVGYNLVLPIEKAMSLPNATQIAVYKEERGKKIEVIGVKTSAPLKAFATNEVSLVIRPSNPQFLPDDAKQVPAIVKDVKDGLSYSVLSAFPGDPNIPPASQWNGKFAVIIPS